jgi:hypothetical protein
VQSKALHIRIAACLAAQSKESDNLATGKILVTPRGAADPSRFAHRRMQ